MPLVNQRRVLLAKIEATYGVDPTPTAATNSILTIDSKIKETFTAIERNVQISSLTKRQSLRGQTFAEVTFKSELVGSGTAGTAPRIGTLLKACAFSETISAGSSVVYTPNSSPISSCTMYLYIDGRQHIISGAVGTPKLTMEAGKQAVIEFNFKGTWNTPSDSSNPTPTFETTVDAPPIVKSAAFTINSISSLIIAKAELDMANTLAIRPSINAATAIQGFFITERKPMLSIDPEAVSIATYDWRTDVLTTPRAVSMVIGATAGNIITLNIPKFNVQDIEYADREKLVVENIKGQLAANSATGDDELTIKFT